MPYKEYSKKYFAHLCKNVLYKNVEGRGAQNDLNQSSMTIYMCVY